MKPKSRVPVAQSQRARPVLQFGIEKFPYLLLEPGDARRVILCMIELLNREAAPDKDCKHPYDGDMLPGFLCFCQRLQFLRCFGCSGCAATRLLATISLMDATQKVTAELDELREEVQRELDR